MVPPALYGGAVAEGRGWKYRGWENAWAASSEPTTLPPASSRLPFARLREGDLGEARHKRG